MKKSRPMGRLEAIVGRHEATMIKLAAEYVRMHRAAHEVRGNDRPIDIGRDVHKKWKDACERKVIERAVDGFSVCQVSAAGREGTYNVAKRFD